MEVEDGGEKKILEVLSRITDMCPNCGHPWDDHFERFSDNSITHCGNVGCRVVKCHNLKIGQLRKI
jgi:hypothetical protein